MQVSFSPVWESYFVGSGFAVSHGHKRILVSGGAGQWSAAADHFRELLSGSAGSARRSILAAQKRVKLAQDAAFESDVAGLSRALGVSMARQVQWLRSSLGVLVEQEDIRVLERAQNLLMGGQGSPRAVTLHLQGGAALVLDGDVPLDLQRSRMEPLRTSNAQVAKAAEEWRYSNASVGYSEWLCMSAAADVLVSGFEHVLAMTPHTQDPAVVKSHTAWHNAARATSYGRLFPEARRAWRLPRHYAAFARYHSVYTHKGYSGSAADMLLLLSEKYSVEIRGCLADPGAWVQLLDVLGGLFVRGPAPRGSVRLPDLLSQSREANLAGAEEALGGQATTYAQGVLTLVHKGRILVSGKAQGRLQALYQIHRIYGVPQHELLAAVGRPAPEELPEPITRSLNANGDWLILPVWEPPAVVPADQPMRMSYPRLSAEMLRHVARKGQQDQYAQALLYLWVLFGETAELCRIAGVDEERSAEVWSREVPVVHTEGFQRLRALYDVDPPSLTPPPPTETQPESRWQSVGGHVTPLGVGSKEAP